LQLVIAGNSLGHRHSFEYHLQWSAFLWHLWRRIFCPKLHLISLSQNPIR
jgi:hypothetical protein